MFLRFGFQTNCIIKFSTSVKFSSWNFQVCWLFLKKLYKSQLYTKSFSCFFNSLRFDTSLRIVMIFIFSEKMGTYKSWPFSSREFTRSISSLVIYEVFFRATQRQSHGGAWKFYIGTSKQFPGYVTVKCMLEKKIGHIPSLRETKRIKPRMNEKSKNNSVFNGFLFHLFLKWFIKKIHI